MLTDDHYSNRKTLLSFKKDERIGALWSWGQVS